MSGFHNADWCECYELYNEQLLGKRFREDEMIIANVLESAAKSRPPGSTVAVIEVGVGSIRILSSLQPLMQKMKDRQFDVWGMQPSKYALDQVNSCWDSMRSQKSPQEQSCSHVRINWAQSLATKFTYALPHRFVQDKADVIIAALGNFHHLLTDVDIKLFLGEASKILNHGNGRLILSFLHEYMPETDPNELTAFGSVQHKYDPRVQEMLVQPQRLSSREHPGLVYVKHPSATTSDGAEYGEVLTKRFKLDVEDSDGALVRSHDMRWDMKVLDGLVLLDHLREAGLQLDKIIDGTVQEIWLVRHRRDGAL